MAPNKDKKTIRFVITETDRHSKGFTIYKVTSMMYSKSTPDFVSKVSVWKRYSDFKKLHAVMKSIYLAQRIKEAYPSFPKPKFFGRFEAEVIEERRLCALNFLEFIARYTCLFTNDSFVQFFESSELEKNQLDCAISLSSESSEDDRNFTEYSNLKFKNNAVLYGKQEKNPSTLNKNTDSSIERSMTVLHDGSDLPNSKENTAQYILIAAAHMSAAFRHEVIAEYEEAFTQYKLGISHLLNGVQTDPDLERRKLIQEKIRKYLQRAEKLYNRHLNCNISVLNKPVTELKNYKVIRVMNSMMLVKDILRGHIRIIKTIEKVTECLEDANNYILRGKVPYVVQLYGCIQTDTTVFLILQFVSSGKLWDYIDLHYKINKMDKKGHVRSSSCDAVMQVISENESNLTNSQLDLPKYSSQKFEFENNTYFDDNAKRVSVPENFNLLDQDLPTTQLLENAQKLLQSVNATLKKSNSIASRMNESAKLLYEFQNDHHLKKSVQHIPEIKINDEHSKKDELEIDHLNYIEDDVDFSETSLSDSFTDVSSIKDKFNLNNRCGIENDNDNSIMCNSIFSNTKVSLEQNIVSEICILDKNNLDMEAALWNIPETIVRKWAAEIICALEALHQQDVIIKDLRPDNLLITEDGHIAMTYIVKSHRSELAHTSNTYVAPELKVFIHPIVNTTAADVWSFGVLLYELLTGYKFQQTHLGEFHPYSTVNVPEYISKDAKSLLTHILKYHPNERLTIPEIKQHSFFIDVDWLSLLNY